MGRRRQDVMSSCGSEDGDWTFPVGPPLVYAFLICEDSYALWLCRPRK